LFLANFFIIQLIYALSFSFAFTSFSFTPAYLLRTQQVAAHALLLPDAHSHVSASTLPSYLSIPLLPSLNAHPRSLIVRVADAGRNMLAPPILFTSLQSLSFFYFLKHTTHNAVIATQLCNKLSLSTLDTTFSLHFSLTFFMTRAIHYLFPRSLISPFYSAMPAIHFIINILKIAQIFLLY
jgi:hypothetical protein